MKYILFLFLFSFSLGLTANPSFFDDTKVKNKTLTQAIELYQGLEFDQAEKLLKGIVKDSSNRLEKAIAYKYLAFIFTLNQNDDKAELFYSKLFDIYPDFALDETTVTPKISTYFKDFHEIWLRTPGDKVRVYPIQVKQLTYDGGIDLKVEWHDPNLEVSYAILKYKQEDEQKYSEIEKRDIKSKNYFYRFKLSFLNEPTIDFNLDYFIELYDYDGKLIKTISSNETPSKVFIDVPGGKLNNYDETSNAWYKSGWFITTMSVLTVAIIGGTTYLLLKDPKEGGPSEAELNLYITNGN